MTNDWINHVKEFATQHRMRYGDALRHPQCKSSYHKSKIEGSGKFLCSACEQKKPLERNSLHPRQCLNENGSSSQTPHQICHDCWFGENGFASETMNHRCPGCIKGIPFVKKRRSQRSTRAHNKASRVGTEPPAVIDLVDSDDD